jgi:hypothetical protein
VGRSEVADIGGPESRSGVAFAVGTSALLLGVVAGVVGLLIVPALLASLVTPVVTGWRDPGPDIIQGCEKSLICSKPGPFFTVWLAAVGAYVVAAVAALRTALNRLAPSSRRPRG